MSPRALVAELVRGHEPAISPNGERIAYTLSTVNDRTGQLEREVWLIDRNGESRQHLTGSDRLSGCPVWSPDGCQIAFVAGGQGVNTVHIATADAPESVRAVFEYPHTILDLAWSPDGTRIAWTTVPVAEPSAESVDPLHDPSCVRVATRIDYKCDGRGFVGDARQQVVVIDIESGVTRQISHDHFDHEMPKWSPDGAWIAARQQYVNGSRLLLFPVVSGGEIRSVGARIGTCSFWSWSPAGDRIIYSGDAPPTFLTFDSQHDFFLHDMTTHSTRRLTHDLPCQPRDHPVWLDDRTVIFHTAERAGSGLYTLDTVDGSVACLTHWEAEHRGMSVDASHRFVVQERGSATEHGEISVFDRETGSLSVITDHNRSLLKVARPARWERRAGERAGQTIESFLLYPPDFDPDRQYPVVLTVHGGPFNHWRYRLHPIQQCLTTHGFLVVAPNPRGSSSYGRGFAQAVVEDWGGEDYLDIMAALDEVLEEPFADPERTGIYGYSYGGYMTAWAIGQTNRFRAAVVGAPVFDLESWYGTSFGGPLWGRAQFGGPPHERHEWYAARSPSTSAHRIRTPTLIIQGEADDDCPIGQGEQLFTALMDSGCPVELARYPGASHGFIEDGTAAQRVDVLDRVLRWFHTHLNIG